MSKLKRGSICWLHFHNMAKPGHPHCGGYGYIKGNAPNHSKKVEDGELYVKVAIKDIFYLRGEFIFSMEVVNKDGSCSYSITTREPDRLTEIEWKFPNQINWSVTQSY